MKSILYVLIISQALGLNAFAHQIEAAEKTAIDSNTAHFVCPLQALERDRLFEKGIARVIDHKTACLSLNVDVNADGRLDYLVVYRNLSIGRRSAGASADNLILVYLGSGETQYQLSPSSLSSPIGGGDIVPGHVDGLFFIKTEKPSTESNEIFLTARPGIMASAQGVYGGLFLLKLDSAGHAIDLSELLSGGNTPGDHERAIKSETVNIQLDTRTGLRVLTYQTKENNWYQRTSSDQYKSAKQL